MISQQVTEFYDWDEYQLKVTKVHHRRMISQQMTEVYDCCEYQLKVTKVYDRRMISQQVGDRGLQLRWISAKGDEGLWQANDQPAGDNGLWQRWILAKSDKGLWQADDQPSGERFMTFVNDRGVGLRLIIGAYSWDEW